MPCPVTKQKKFFIKLLKSANLIKIKLYYILLHSIPIMIPAYIYSKRSDHHIQSDFDVANFS